MYRSEDFYEDQRSSIGSPASTIAKEETEFNSTDIAHARQNNKSNENNGLYVWSKVRILTQYFPQRNVMDVSKCDTRLHIKFICIIGHIQL